jgi:hypothetical protein
LNADRLLGLRYDAAFPPSARRLALMPTAIPAGATAGLPPARMIDPRGHRFGAATSAAILILAFAAGVPVLVAVVLVTIGVSAAFGMRYSVYGALWRRMVRALCVRPVELEHEYPPRFAQTLGSIALVVALLAFAAGYPPIGWLFALAVALLQGVLGITGYCLGCRLYFLRWWLPGQVTRIWSRRGGGVSSASAGGIATASRLSVLRPGPFADRGR